MVNSGFSFLFPSKILLLDKEKIKLVLENRVLSHSLSIETHVESVTDFGDSWKRVHRKEPWPVRGGKG